VKHAVGIAVLVLAVSVIGSAAAYNDDFGNTFGSKQECLDWWSAYPDACSAPDDGGGGGSDGSGDEQPPPDEQPQPEEQGYPIVFASSPGTITLTEGDGSSDTWQASDGDSSPQERNGEPSPVGCRNIDVTRDIQSSIVPFHFDRLGDFHHFVHWCWVYPRITEFYSFCWSNVQGWAVNDRGCESAGYWYDWRGDDHGGRYSFQQANWGNCIFRWGCFNEIDPYINIWINGNGTWLQSQGD
jgi:hypothetical protein